VVETVIGHVFVGQDNIFLYDGTTPRPLDNALALRNWLFRDMNASYRYKTIVTYDRVAYTVSIYYVSSAGSSIDSCVVYHLGTKKWGRANRFIEAAVAYISPALTYAGSAAFTTYDALPAIPYDSPFWTSGSAVQAAFNTSHTVQSLSGGCASSSFTTGDLGDESSTSLCDKVRVRYQLVPTTSVVSGYTRNQEGVSLTAGAVGSLQDGRHDLLQCGRFHRFNVAQTGDWSASAMSADLTPAGI
jgi:hypothetical protein